MAETDDKKKSRTEKEWETVIKFAEFMQPNKNKEPEKDMIMFRRFEKLRRYQLLHLQAQLANCTNDLMTIELAKAPNYKLFHEVMSEAGPLLKTYSDALISYRQICELPCTPDYVRKILEECAGNGHWEINSHFDPNGWTELSSLKESEKGFLHKYLDEENRLKKKLSRTLGEVEKASTNDGRVFYSDNILRWIDLVVVTLLAGILLAAPVATLFVHSKLQKLAVMLPCMLVALGLSSLMTERTQNNRLTFAVAYAAFVVAILGGGNQ